MNNRDKKNTCPSADEAGASVVFPVTVRTAKEQLLIMTILEQILTSDNFTLSKKKRAELVRNLFKLEELKDLPEPYGEAYYYAFEAIKMNNRDKKNTCPGANEAGASVVFPVTVRTAKEQLLIRTILEQILTSDNFTLSKKKRAEIVRNLFKLEELKDLPEPYGIAYYYAFEAIKPMIRYINRL